MAVAIVADGEGSTKTVRLRVDGAHDDHEAEAVARAVANSPLVKAAFFGRDPNWGRIVQAAGQAIGQISGQVPGQFPARFRPSPAGSGRRQAGSLIASIVYEEVAVLSDGKPVALSDGSATGSRR